jgi:hypothetical protein
MVSASLQLKILWPIYMGCFNSCMIICEMINNTEAVLSIRFRIWPLETNISLLKEKTDVVDGDHFWFIKKRQNGTPSVPIYKHPLPLIKGCLHIGTEGVIYKSWIKNITNRLPQGKQLQYRGSLESQQFWHQLRSDVEIGLHSHLF